MNRAVDNLQKNIFAILLYTSGFGLIISDLVLGQGHQTIAFAFFDVLIIALGVLSFSFIRSGLTYILIFTTVCILANLSYSEASLYVSLNGLREIIIIFMICIFLNKVFMEGSEELALNCINIFKRFAIVFLIAQLPVCAAQFIAHGPSDYVGGTYGSAGTGTLTFAVICLVYFLHRFTKGILLTVLLYVALIPLLLNETKVSFILIPMMILFIRFQPKLKNILLAVAFAGLFLFLFDKFYSHNSLQFDDNITGIFSPDFLDDYLLGDIYKYDDVPRFTRIILAWQIISQQANTLLFGLEYGMFRGSNVSGVSRLAETYNWLLIGTRPYLFFLLMQGGVMLVTAMFWLIAYINNFFKTSNKFKLYLLIIYLFILVYADMLRHQSLIAIYFFLVYYVNSKMYSEKPVEETEEETALIPETAYN